MLVSSRHGVNEELLLRGHGFSRGVLSSLIRRRLAVAQREVVMAGGKAIEVIRMRITAAGRRAVGDEYLATQRQGHAVRSASSARSLKRSGIRGGRASIYAMTTLTSCMSVAFSGISRQ